MTPTRTFSDLDLNFMAHPVTGDVSRLYDSDAIKAAIRNLVLTQFYERPFHPEIGSPVQGLMFEPYSPALDSTMGRAILLLLQSHEPRAVISSVNVESNVDANSINITVTFTIINTVTPLTVNIILYRNR